MRRAYIVIDLGFGDAGKGSTVDAIVRKTKADLVVRFNGGPQAAHNVVLPDGTHHTFSQFGSGTLAGARTYLRPEMWLDPVFLQIEAEKLEKIGIVNPLSLITAHWECGIVTPYHQAMGKLRELARGNNANGSCGMGVGEAMADTVYCGQRLTLGDIMNVSTVEQLEADLGRLQRRKFEHWLAIRAQYDIDNLVTLGDVGLKAIRSLTSHEFNRSAAKLYFDIVRRITMDRGHRERATELLAYDTVVFEGAQGVLIDQAWGFRPYNTWSDCTAKGAKAALRSIGMPAKIIGVTRPYMVRHGRGPLPTEMMVSPDSHVYQSKVGHNVHNTFQGSTRIGFLDLMLLKYALRTSPGLAGLAISHLDQLDLPAQASYMYTIDRKVVTDVYNDMLTTEDMLKARPTLTEFAKDRNAWLRNITTELHTPVWMTSDGPTYQDKNFLAEEEFA